MHSSSNSGVTVLEDSGYAGSWPAGLDPATNTYEAADQSYMNCVYGDLFELGTDGKVIDDLATGYSVSQGGKVVSIYLRPGVRFTDGTPFDSQAVAWNLRRDLASPLAPPWPPAKVTTKGADEVQITLEKPFAAIIHSFFDSSVNWIASPTAYKKMGEKLFERYPVGAGPFEVVKDVFSSVLVLRQNPGYWQSGHPYLKTLTFESTPDDKSAYKALLAGKAQAYEDMSTPSVAKLLPPRFTKTQQGSTSPFAIQLDSLRAPFDNVLAREAIYYATDSQALVAHLFGGKYPVTESFTAPAGLFYEAKVPNYRGYDLAMAKALVKRMGGLQVELGTVDTSVAMRTASALQSQWSKAGIKTTVIYYTLSSLVTAFEGGKWEAMLQSVGSWDPASGFGVAFRFSSSIFSGVRDTTLDSLLNQAAATLDPTRRAALYQKAAERIARKAYCPFLFAFAPVNVAVKALRGPGLTTPLPAAVITPSVLWEDVSYSP